MLGVLPTLANAGATDAPVQSLPSKATALQEKRICSCSFRTCSGLPNCSQQPLVCDQCKQLRPLSPCEFRCRFQAANVTRLQQGGGACWAAQQRLVGRRAGGAPAAVCAGVRGCGPRYRHRRQQSVRPDNLDHKCSSLREVFTYVFGPMSSSAKMRSHRHVPLLSDQDGCQHIKSRVCSAIATMLLL
jgi:hypothetical protein